MLDLPGTYLGAAAADGFPPFRVGRRPSRGAAYPGPTWDQDAGRRRWKRAAGLLNLPGTYLGGRTRPDGAEGGRPRSPSPGHLTR